MKNYLYAFFILFFVSCSIEDDPIDYDAQNENEIKSYLTRNNLSAEKTASGLYYIIKKNGTGEMPDDDANVTVKYKGYFTDGTVFDQSDKATFKLDEVIKGFQEGISLLNENGEATLFIPSRLGYGEDGNSKIPGGAVIIFDVTLLKIN